MSDDLTTSEGLVIDSLTTTYGLNQLIADPTHLLPNSSSYIGLIFTDQPNLAIDSGDHPSLHSKCHHRITYCKFNLIINYPPPYDWQVWDYKKADTTLIKKALSQVNCYFLFDKKDVNDQVKILNDTITNAFLILYQIKYCWWQGPSIDERTD